MHFFAKSSFHRLLAVSAAMLVGSVCSASVVAAPVVPVPPTPVVGSSNPVSAEPPVTRPTSTPCVVTLMSNQEFADFNGKTLTYAPPTACPGPWAKVVLAADFTVTAGRQYDRTASFYLGNANIYFGTTAEPRKALSPSWHIERDLTDLSALFTTAQTGQAQIGNLVNSTYTGIIYVNATLSFYPADAANLAPRVADVIVPVSGTDNAVALNTTSDKVTQTLNLPLNTEKVYLDVIAQSQSADEQWFLCVPSAQAGALETCGNTAFRETEISIDGTRAGVAPVYPWIYTGGLDPYLWEPITGLQTLNFKPYRVDLTPYAGVLGDGNQHTIAVSVFNANNYFVATANLLVFTDHGSAVVTGGLISNDLESAPLPDVSENLVTDSSGTTTGAVDVRSVQDFSIVGFVNTSHGRVKTAVEGKIRFDSYQTFNVNPVTQPEIQHTAQTNSVDSGTTITDGVLIQKVSHHIVFPLLLDYSYVVNSDGSQTQVVTSDQKDIEEETSTLNGLPLYDKQSREHVNSTDTLQITAAGSIAAPGVGNTTASYWSLDSYGNCYSRTLTAANQVLTKVTDGHGCQ